MASSIPDAPPSLPVQPIAPAAVTRNTPSSTPAWTSGDTRRTGFGPLMIVLITALVTFLVYILGKNFLNGFFTQS